MKRARRFVVSMDVDTHGGSVQQGRYNNKQNNRKHGTNLY
mgnify:CR=1 FL=1